jgi:hypothetical protein
MIRQVNPKRSPKKQKLWNDPYIPMPELLKEAADAHELRAQKTV